MEEESWKTVEGFDEAYQVSNLGRIRDFDGTMRHIGQFVSGYARVCLKENGKFKNIRFHRLVAILFVENPDELPEVNHDDGNKMNNRADNLSWTTNQGNMDHAKATGLVWKHEAINTAKLTKDLVLQIRLEYSTGKIGQRPLAAKYGVTKTAIAEIVNNKTWKGI